MNSLLSQITQNFYSSSPYSRVATVYLMFVACEMAIKTISELAKPSSKEKSHNISVNLGGTFFYGLAAVNILPCSAIIGATAFAIYSGSETDYKKNDAYLMTKITGPIVTGVANCFIEIIKAIWNIVEPILTAFGKAVYAILSSIPLPDHPIWICTALLGVGIGIYKFAIPMILKS